MTLVLIIASLTLFLFGQREGASFLALVTISVAIVESANIMQRSLLMSTLSRVRKGE